MAVLDEIPVTNIGLRPGGKRQDVLESVRNARLAPVCGSHVNIVGATMTMTDHRVVTGSW